MSDSDPDQVLASDPDQDFRVRSGSSVFLVSDPDPDPVLRVGFRSGT